MSKGYLVISLDFELLWGVFDKTDPLKNPEYFSKTKELIPELLNIFNKNNIHCTWALVGMLFNKDWVEWEANIPKTLPDYYNINLSSYNFGKNFRKQKGSEDFCFSLENIKKIAATPYQEIATHTYSHYYCLEEGQSLISFKADMEKTVGMAKKEGFILESLVFPRNQFNPEYLEICRDMGIKNVRTNPDSWYWKNPNSNDYLTKISRTGDAYLPFGKKSYKFSQLNKTADMPLKQKASRFFRPWENNPLLHKLKVKRIMAEMTKAAKNKEIYHLWWHPHNFANSPLESLADLNKIIGHFKYLQDLYNFQSANMREIGKLF